MSDAIPMEHRKEELNSLIEALDDLITVLELDPSCNWTKHFRTAQSRAKMLSSAITQDALNSFSASVTSVYGGMGSFNDYYPCAPEKRLKAPNRIHSMENLDTFSSAVYDRAVNLRVGDRGEGPTTRRMPVPASLARPSSPQIPGRKQWLQVRKKPSTIRRTTNP